MINLHSSCARLDRITQVKEIEKVIKAMKNCEQMKGLSVYEHGESVHNYYKDIFNHVTKRTPLTYEWKIPEFVYSLNSQDFKINIDIMEAYHVFHDCGKPFCKTIDENGKVHFYNHAKVSKLTWDSFGGDKLISLMIELDMVLHNGSNEDIMRLSKEKSIVYPMILTALSELHSNASMFGGIDSVSFKIKYKKLNKNIKKLIKLME